MPEVIAIFGPTGVGKTAVAIAVANVLRERGDHAVAVSADSLQIYRGLETLTGAASPAEQQRLEHRLISFVDPSESFSAGRFAELAHRDIDRILAAGGYPIVVGGTGLYLRAALAELSLKPPVPPEVRARWQQRLAEQGPRALHAQLQAAAPQAAAAIEPTDSQRITRALELLEVGHTPDSSDELWTEHTRRPSRLFGLTLARERLYAQIDARVDAMIAAGAVAQVQAVAAADPGPTARKAVGFQELMNGDVEAMKLRTRQYARRQLTWMRKLPNVTLLDMGELTPEDAAGRIVASLTPR